MPDLDQLLDTLIADVTAGTRAPGAPTAIKQAQRKRAKVAAAGAVGILALGGGLAAGNLGGTDQVSPIEDPTSPSSESPTVPESVEPSPGSPEFFKQELAKTLTQVPGWPITDNDRGIEAGPCWQEFESSEDITAAGGGGGYYISAPGTNDEVWVVTGGYIFRSAAAAADVVARHADVVASCTAAAWRTRPIAQTGAFLASTADKVIWMQRDGRYVATLQVNTTDGPPPLGVQVEIADLMRAELKLAFS